MNTKQAEKHLLISFYLTQGLLFLCAWFLLWWQDRLHIGLIGICEGKWWMIGAGVGLVIVGIDLLLTYLVPEKWMDDGGINRLLFKDRTLIHIFIIAFVSSWVEELLFRGALQYWLGIWGTSVIFVLLHIRYLRKWVMVTVVGLVSLALGLLVEKSGFLAPAIAAHWTVNFCMGIFIQYVDNSPNEIKDLE
ncbi:CPBP family intramembrane glutamic endopeptidase [Thermoflavimicrobium dichotomicum]|uniref:CAAX prenyl protease 2/Lysostaphin resistance protein A-like domain-containing protein n=1 Tax=Thermoflavimicrobium dichotomicum TaxID=46223 RepID=A0A1I3SHU3_9BACL|nr:type II CAAX endopeptidase family protein [Thermoflavimicrobium dichotomicum]SFJ57309.1 hypothetical protein SAMN05421852_1138 [Thermoflavimicrobium dichotomicum]